MKYMAKGPGGVVQELTREELQTPSLVSHLNIDSSWVVRVGDEWLPLSAFLNLSGEQLRERSAKSDTRYSDNVFAPNARWTPASVLCLVMRLIGFYFLTQVVQGLVALASGLTGPGSMSFRLLIGPLLSYACYVAVGLYLLMGAKAIVAWAFRGQNGVR